MGSATATYAATGGTRTDMALRLVHRPAPLPVFVCSVLSNLLKRYQSPKQAFSRKVRGAASPCAQLQLSAARARRLCSAS